VLVPLLLLAWTFRLLPILDNRFHPDEALYGYWGLLIGRGIDPWLTTVSADKPPLLPYLVAGAQALFGDSEFSVRLVGLAAGLVTVPLVAALSRALYRDGWAAAAAICVGFSPFAILFSATAFTDPLMVALGVAACTAAARGRPAWTGLLAGLAVATKQTALVWVPLVAALQIPNPKSQSPRVSRWLSALGFLSGVLFVLVLVFAWDAVRVARGAESFWRAGVSDFGGLRLIWPQELPVRLRGWLGLARYLFDSPVINAVLLIGLGPLVWSALARHPRAREPFVDLCLVSFLIIYFLLHWLWAFPVWDRYLLPLVPVLALLLGRILSLFVSLVRSNPPDAPIHNPSDAPIYRGFPIRHLVSVLPLLWGRILSLFASLVRRSPLSARHLSFVICHFSLILFLSLPALDAARSLYPVGGDHGAYDGIDEVGAFLHGLPEGTVVYHHWLGWHYRYYLFDAPVYLAYWPAPAWLARDVQAFGAAGPRYLAVPSWDVPARVDRALAGVGYGLDPVLATTRRDGTRSFTVYRVLPLAIP
jgi:4-amino-4-deoxy-L-arabinose transferase-like glycosyltransferase